MNERRKKIKSMLLIMLLMVCTGCMHQTDEDAGSKQGNANRTESAMYEEKLRLSQPEGSYYNYCVKSDGIYITMYQDDENQKENTTLRIYKMNSDGTDVQEMVMPEGYHFQLQQSEFDYDAEGNLYYMTVADDAGQDSARLFKYGTDGKKKAEIAMSDLAKNAGGESWYFCVKEDGTVAVFNAGSENHSAVYLLNEELSPVNTISITQGRLAGIVTSNAGDFLCVWEDDTDDGSYCVAAIKGDGDLLDKSHKMNIADYVDIFSGNGAYDLYYTDEYGIYGYTLKGEQSEKVFDYMASGVTDTYVKPIGNETFIGETEVDEEHMNLVIYAKKESAQDQSREILTYATLNMDQDIKEAIYAYNNAQTDVSIEIRDYSSEVDPIGKMNTDIIAGDIPDLFDLKDLSVEQYVQKGLLEDLTPYYDNDSEIHKEDLLSSVLQAMETDGKLYYVSPGFQVDTLAAKVSDVGTEDGWNYEDLNALLQKKDKKTQLLYLNSKQDVLHFLLWYESSDYVDRQAATCSFDGQDFKNLLEICNTYCAQEEKDDWEESEALLLRKGDILFRQASTDMDSYKETIAAFGEDVNFIGLPVADKKGNYIVFSSQIGISSKSKLKDEAWKFLRTLMSKDYQGSVMSFETLPTRQDCFELKLEAEMATEDYTNEMGREIFVRKGEEDIDGISYEIKPLTQEEADQFVDLVNRAVKAVEPDENIMEIVEEEAKSYFAGDRTLDDTADIIQKRVTTYINESR